MKKIVYYIASSIDGYIADVNGGVERFLMEGAHADEFQQSLNEYDTVLMGRKTYEFGFQYGIKPGEPAYPGLRHIIVSGTLKFDSNQYVQLVNDEVIAYITRLKKQAGKSIWLCGGGHLAGLLAQHQLIDEVILKVNPIVLGQGIPLFAGLESPLTLQATQHTHYKNGVSLLKYEVVKSATNGVMPVKD
ncbi:dihydrofolate reductase family protein [uncultured Microscilla sp.]|uniref:dihydrofolate reductase family protein n=1 Tax=uncultured Microscilla sp. TaxID=432653 RepID=UPI00260BD3A5|nr:dihydrofolate reductase family protein [uncultured Microscilla sp.]